jgi:hypothetical protein
MITHAQNNPIWITGLVIGPNRKGVSIRRLGARYSKSLLSRRRGYEPTGNPVAQTESSDPLATSPAKEPFQEPTQADLRRHEPTQSLCLRSSSAR